MLKYYTKELPLKNKLANLDLNQTLIEEMLGYYGIQGKMY